MDKRRLADELGRAEAELQAALELHNREGTDETRRAWMAAKLNAERVSQTAQRFVSSDDIGKARAMRVLFTIVQPKKTHPGFVDKTPQNRSDPRQIKLSSIFGILARR